MLDINSFIDNNKDNMIEDLRQLVKIRSCMGEAQEGMPFGSEPAKALEHMLDVAYEMGFEVTNYENYMGTADFGEGEPQLAIMSHLDVVPEGSGWTFPPFDITEHDGKLYGRGAIDDKGPAVAALYALYAIKELGIPLKKAVRLIFGTNEENGSEDLEYYLKEEKMPPMVFTPDGSYPIINAEKGRMQGVLKAKYKEGTQEGGSIISINGGETINAVPHKATAIVTNIRKSDVEISIDNIKLDITFDIEEQQECLKITAHGKGAHGSTPHLGDNAITGLLELLGELDLRCECAEICNNLLALFPHGETNGTGADIACSDEQSGELTTTLSILTVQDGKFECKLDIRFPCSQNLTMMKMKFLRSVEIKGFEGGFEQCAKPHIVDADSEFVKTLLGIYEEQTGEKGYTIAIGGGTYVHDIDGAVAFGAEFPGEQNNMHGADEFIKIDTFLKNAKIFAHTIVKLCGE